MWTFDLERLSMRKARGREMYWGGPIFIKTKNPAPTFLQAKKSDCYCPGTWVGLLRAALGRLDVCMGMCDNGRGGPFQTWGCVTLWIHPGSLKVHPRLAFDPTRYYVHKIYMPRVDCSAGGGKDIGWWLGFTETLTALMWCSATQVQLGFSRCLLSDQMTLCEPPQQCHGLVWDGLCLTWASVMFRFTTQVPQALGVEERWQAEKTQWDIPARETRAVSSMSVRASSTWDGVQVLYWQREHTLVCDTIFIHVFNKSVYIL